MELIFLNKEFENTDSLFMRLDLKVLFTNLEEFVYILSINEWHEWTEMHRLLCEVVCSAKSHSERADIFRNFGMKNSANPSSILSLLYAYVNGSKYYKMLYLTPEELGDCYAIFFAKKEKAIDRSEEIKRKILEIKRVNQANSISLN